MKARNTHSTKDRPLRRILSPNYLCFQSFPMKFRTFPGLLLPLILLSALPCLGQQPGSGSLPAARCPLTLGPLRLISSQFGFTEGPTPDKKGNVFFTDQPNNKIWEYEVSGRLRLFLDSAGRSNGMAFDRKGNLISCADENQLLWSISPRRKIRVLVQDYLGKKLNGPNDVWIDPRGGMYLTDPYYQRSYWKRTRPDLPGEYVFYLPPGSSSLQPVATDLVKPNGIMGTPDGTHLYVADIGAGKTYRYRIAADGTLEGKELFVRQGSDGMTMDARGNLYLTGNGVTIYDPSGKELCHIPIPDAWTSHACFGGRHYDRLFITATHSIYEEPMRVKGSLQGSRYR